jgi:hypothetical protein
MNERIRELADQCRIETYGVNGELLEFGFNEEKFAELIVRECAHVAVFNDSGTVATAAVAGHMAAGRSIAAQMIKEHFGVDE